MVDKDLNEIKILSAFFPYTRILIFIFHVLKYLSLVSRKPEHGKISPEDHGELDALTHNMERVNFPYTNSYKNI